MSEETHAIDENLVRTSEIVAAFVANNAIGASDLPGLIGNVYTALGGLDQPVVGPTVELVPAVSIKKSVTPDFIVCLDDGKKFKSMKRHLAGLGMTPDEYRTKWGLPSDYPMVAPNYTATRSALAISSGLGRKTSAGGGDAQAQEELGKDPLRECLVICRRSRPRDGDVPARKRHVVGSTRSGARFVLTHGHIGHVGIVVTSNFSSGMGPSGQCFSNLIMPPSCGAPSCQPCFVRKERATTFNGLTTAIHRRDGGWPGHSSTRSSARLPVKQRRVWTPIGMISH